MKGRAIKYTEEQLAWLESNATMDRRSLTQAFNARFHRNISLQNIKALCSRKGWKTGRTGCFTKGQVPFNKGKPHPVAANHPNCRKNQFKKGHEPHNTQFLGHERFSKEGYIEVSVAETNPHTGYGRRYVLKHRHEWEKANGAIPEGHVLKCLDGDKANCDPSNWQAIPRALLPRLAGGNRYNRKLAFDDAPPELKSTILAVAKLQHAKSPPQHKDQTHGRTKRKPQSCGAGDTGSQR